ncbi:hypothetical protein HDV01_004586, partial [Terramyces sp. JEL0728]
IKNEAAMFCFKNINLLVFPNKQFYTRNTNPVYLLQTLLDYYSYSRDFEQEPDVDGQKHGLVEKDSLDDSVCINESTDDVTDDTSELKRKWTEVLDLSHELHQKLKNQKAIIDDINEISQRAIDLKKTKLKRSSIVDTFYSIF